MQDYSTPVGGEIAADGGKIIKQALLRADVSTEAVPIIMFSVTTGTLKQYLKPLREWSLFCMKIGYRRCEAHQVLAFLTKKFNAGVSAGTLNTYRSALSFVLGERISRNSWIS